jgi:pimeloyl-ACP methyl ester carboxylesterase
MIAVQPTTRTVAVPGATITYDVRPAAVPTDQPLLVLIGSPMGASGFGTLASHFTDRTVVTYDPRGVERSVRTDDWKSDPNLNADDLHAVLADLGVDGVDLFGSSGGAATGLAMVTRHPSDVRTLVAHEPPLASMLPDRDAAYAALQAMSDAYQRDGFGAGMARFIALVSLRGEIPAGPGSQPAPDPAMFGLPTGDDGSRNDALLGQSLIGNTHYEPDFAALRAFPGRIVIAVGEESDGEMAHRGGEAVAARLGLTPVVFPSGHGGFLGNEYGMPGKPDEFAARLREVISADG